MNNPAPFGASYEFEITFECLEPLQKDLEWKVTYVGSATSSEHDQVLDSLLVGPVPVGVNKFVFQTEAPDLSKIPDTEVIGVTVVLLSCSYDEREFVRVGYYVNNEYTDETLQADPPAKPVVEKVRRNILAEKPRVTRFAIKWDSEESAPAEYPPDQPDVDAAEDDEAAYGAEEDVRDEAAAEAQAEASSKAEDEEDAPMGGVDDEEKANAEVKDEGNESDAGSEDLEAESSGSDEEGDVEDDEGEGEEDAMDTAEDEQKPLNADEAGHSMGKHQHQAPDVMKQWQFPHKKQQNKSQKYAAQISTTIEPGDVGIFVTCNRNMEAKCVREIRNLFDEYYEKLYGTENQTTASPAKVNDAIKPEESTTNDNANDIEAEIAAEVSEMRKPNKDRPFENVRLSTACICFIKTRPPIDPAHLVNSICVDAFETGAKKTRWVMRLTPMMAIGKASETGLKEAAEKALAPWFWTHRRGGVSQRQAEQQDKPIEGTTGVKNEDKDGSEDGTAHENKGAGENEQDEDLGNEAAAAPTHAHAAESTPFKPVKYAIRPTIRNSTHLTRMGVIEKVADLVGKEHPVNLGNPDAVILVEVLTNICGVSVVPGADFFKTKKYNLAEIYNLHHKEEERDEDDDKADEQGEWEEGKVKAEKEAATEKEETTEKVETTELPKEAEQVKQESET
ncbi:MAG: Histone chaperone asf1 [Alyxoria varia]|nr:MAG: Histone chaperone asf1 [Alyxoria varia]